ncbi:MAG: hypothetical protein ACRC28_09635 [Clostridium sp.]|uniref:hypothetical protein n=1 Tax=Clostridium sp. TaxID=1506 RepID=UPI003F3F7F4C
MKSKIIIVLAALAFLVLAFSGCEKVPGNNMLKIKAPVNDDLSISGTWKVESYKVLESNMYPKSDINHLIKENIYIGNNEINMDNQIFKNVNYKLKVVSGNYCIAYNEKYYVSDLGVQSVNVITAADKNNVIFDFFSITPDSGYIYYRGVLLKVSKIGNVTKSDFTLKNGEASINSLSVNESSTETGVLIGLKTLITNDKGTENYAYRTLWVSYANNKVNIEEAPDVFFPRMTGMWTIIPKEKNINGYYKQYFEVNPFNGKGKNIQNEALQGNYNLYQNINYVGNDYIGVQTYEGNDFKGNYSNYKMIPIDIFPLNKGVALEDIYNNGINPVFQKAFSDEYNNLNGEEKTLVNGSPNFKDFTLKRSEGKWDIEGKISPLNSNNPSYDFETNIKPNSNLVKYDTLYVPWRMLRAEMPTIEDAYTSPDGKLAVIFIKGELLVYKINNNKLDGKPIFRYNLNENDKVIMAEWCSGDYVSYWNTSFNEYKNQMEEN